MNQVECLAPVRIADYVRWVLATGKPLLLLNVMDKPVGGGIANLTSIRLIPSGNHLEILPS